ncbi:arrestin domain-containing protein 17-like isoform X1 [Homalodisca vitripennis]|uniref:arrestin domain-containing protein 17-like isoform X1 n=1 Tax=Homalodisca vitripennis TaxID=197043 RepID=UPI001EE9E6F7|nr:arrestin domain-containing protein 17-like isoform X1 [Homalodisca vitripennis]
MGLTNFQIVLDSPTGAYYAGTNVTGKLQFTLDKPKKIRAIIIQFLGVAKTSWSETESVRRNDGNTGNETVTFTATEEYFSNKYNLAGGPNSEIEIPPGDHVYPFSTTLPPLLPSSFEGEHGNIRYTVRATLDRPWKFDQNCEKVFTVVTPVDLNYNVKAKEPVKLELEKYFCCCWCKSGPLAVVINMPYSGFVPGQNIPVTLEVDNASNVRVDNVIVKLEKVLKWKAREPKNKEREDKVEIVKLTLDAVEPNGSQCYTQQLAVPVMPPCNLDQCSIINCSYTLQVTAAVSGCHSNLYGEVPIFLGTVPVYQTPTAASPAAPPSAPSPQPGAQQPGIGFDVNPGPTEGNMYPVLRRRGNSSYEELPQADPEFR